MTILVTGGGGFVMSNLVKLWLLEHPSERAIVVDTMECNATLARFFGSLGSRIDWQTGDILDRELWHRLSTNSDIDYLVHGAAATSILRQMHTNGPAQPGLPGVRRSISVNIDGTLNVLEFANSLSNLKRMVHVSSGSVYAQDGPSDRALRENEFVKPEGLYGISKFSGEAFCRLCADELKIPACVIRLSGVYGPMDRVTPTRDVNCAPKLIAHSAITGRSLRILSLDAAGDFINAEDVGSAIASLLLSNSLNHDVYNVAAGRTHTIEELVELAREKRPELKVQETTSLPLDIDYDPAQILGRWGAYDISRIHQDTGWSPRPLRKAFHSYISWLETLQLDQPTRQERSQFGFTGD